MQKLSTRRPSPSLIVALAVLFLALAGVGGAANGQSLILGKADNSASARTGLLASINDRALQLTNTNTNSGATALGLTVASGRPPLLVNSGAGKATYLNVDKLDGIDSTGFWKLGGNAVGSGGILGTTTNQPLELEVNGQRALRLEPTGGPPNVIGGWSGNAVEDGARGATIAGGAGFIFGGNRVTDGFGTVGGGLSNQAGDANTDPSTAPFATVSGGSLNKATGDYSAVGGGISNTAGGEYSTVAGGQENAATTLNATVGGGYSNTASYYYATVGGGDHNTASDPSATIAGGSYNISSGVEPSTVGGGEFNRATGRFATVPGGVDNRASGFASFAAGNSAIADDEGSFVWSDGNWLGGDHYVYSPGLHSFSAHATGGFNFWTNQYAPTTGCWIAPGGGSLNCSSSRKVKKDFAPVDRARLLRRLARVPVSTWSYKHEQSGVRHIGPMAQDFKRAFRIGEDETSIAMVDADGVALAAIQGLYRQNLALQNRVARLERVVARLSGRRPARSTSERGER